MGQGPSLRGVSGQDTPPALPQHPLGSNTTLLFLHVVFWVLQHPPGFPALWEPRSRLRLPIFDLENPSGSASSHPGKAPPAAEGAHSALPRLLSASLRPAASSHDDPPPSSSYASCYFKASPTNPATGSQARGQTALLSRRERSWWARRELLPSCTIFLPSPHEGLRLLPRAEPCK